jgi:hypothetical protein
MDSSIDLKNKNLFNSKSQLKLALLVSTVISSQLMIVVQDITVHRILHLWRSSAQQDYFKV